MNDGLEIMAERARSERYSTDQKHISATHCPRCGFRYRADGVCWYGCDNPAALAAQEEVNKAILSVYDKPTKPTKTCKVHAGLPISNADTCVHCAADHAIMVRWEIRAGMRCKVCGKTTRYCTCSIASQCGDDETIWGAD